MGIFSSAHAFATPFSRMSVQKRENSTSTAAILCTLAALRIEFAPTSDRLIPPSLPALTYSAIYPTVSSIGVLGSTRAPVLISNHPYIEHERHTLK